MCYNEKMTTNDVPIRSRSQSNDEWSEHDIETATNIYYRIGPRLIMVRIRFHTERLL